MHTAATWDEYIQALSAHQLLQAFSYKTTECGLTKSTVMLHNSAKSTSLYLRTPPEDTFLNPQSIPESY